jgi:hypothetical protein
MQASDVLQCSSLSLGPSVDDAGAARVSESAVLQEAAALAAARAATDTATAAAALRLVDDLRMLMARLEQDGAELPVAGAAPDGAGSVIASPALQVVPGPGLRPHTTDASRRAAREHAARKRA